MGSTHTLTQINKKRTYDQKQIQFLNEKDGIELEIERKSKNEADCHLTIAQEIKRIGTLKNSIKSK